RITTGAEELERHLARTKKATSYYPLSTYPDDWKELSDRRLRSVRQAQPEKLDNAQLRRLLDETVVSFTFVELPLADAIDFLQALGSVNIVVDPSALGAGRRALRDADQTVTLRLNNVPMTTALTLLAEQINLTPYLQDGLVVLSDGTIDRMERRLAEAAPRTVTQVYDVRDLLGDVPNFTGATFELEKDLKKSGESHAALFADEEADEDADKGKSREEALAELNSLLRQTVAPGTWDDGKSRIRSLTDQGTIVVTHTPETQARVANLLADLRGTKGPQVQMGKRLTEQQAKGIETETVPGFDDFTNGVAQIDVNGNGIGEYASYGWAGTGGRPAPGTGERNKELERFIGDNYGWRWGVRMGPADGGWSYLPAGGAQNAPTENTYVDLARKLATNRGQKVQVASVNLNTDATRANGLGVNFTVGNNGLSYAVIDEAQFRTLMEFSEANGEVVVGANPSEQDAIVGTDALVANGMVANTEFAADNWNRLNILDNPIRLAHERYVLIDNGEYLTAVRAGAMQHWTQKSAPVVFVQVPQTIDVPRTGQLVRFEKTLVQPEDDLVIRATYYWKGGAP
ncbi:MAG TPA: hypothetical protein VMX57_06815, partial [Planctomycetota bacterium]|nr:hypothetical protein [Planctomycetota bacterium]